MNENKKQPTLLICIVGICSFLMSLGTLYWFILNVIYLAKQLGSKTPSVTLELGIFAMLGASLGLGALSSAAIFTLTKKRPVSGQTEYNIIRIALVGIALIFIVPCIIYFPVDYYLKTRGYKVCDEISHQRLRTITIVYTLPGECERIVAEKNKKKWDLEDY